jgi:membrane protease YdiL (CAAX protease family)
MATRMSSPRVNPNSTAPYYHGDVVYVRTSSAGETAEPKACNPGDLAAEGGTVPVTAETLLSASPGGPFEPAPLALERDGRLRDRLAASLHAPSLPPWSRVRLGVLVLAAIPALVLLELDRELLASRNGSLGPLAIDAIIAAYVAFELTRRTPRMPGVAAVGIVAIALRFGLMASRLCGYAHPVVWGGLVLASVAAGLVLARAPSRSRVAFELEDRLGIGRSQAFAARLPPEASGALVGLSLATALGLPALLFAMRRAELGLGAQAAAFAAYGFFAPELTRRALDRDTPRPAIVPVRALLGIFTGLALTAALMSAVTHFFDVGSEIARCAGKLDAEARRLLAKEAAETGLGIARVRGSGLLAFMILAVVPLAEERIYRDLLMRVLSRKYGASYGLLASAVVFGFAHVGIYEVALYQTVLLGLAFGVAWAEGGIIAAVVVHALWNGLLIW